MFRRNLFLIPLGLCIHLFFGNIYSRTTEMIAHLALPHQEIRLLCSEERKILVVCASHVRSHLLSCPENSVMLGIKLTTIEKELTEFLAKAIDLENLKENEYKETQSPNKKLIVYQAFSRHTIAFFKIYFLLRCIEFGINKSASLEKISAWLNASNLNILCKELCGLDFNSSLITRINYTFDLALNLPAPSPESLKLFGNILRMFADAESTHPLKENIPSYIKAAGWMIWTTLGKEQYASFLGAHRDTSSEAQTPSIVSTADDSEVKNGVST